MAESENTDKKRNWFKRHKFLTGIIALVLVIMIVNAGGGTSDTSNTSANKSESNSEKNEDEAKTASIGESVRDGKFEFVVKSVKCGETTVGTNEYLQDKATGQFCRVSMSIKNIGNEAQSLFGDNQKLLDNQGREFSYDSTATIYASSDDSGSTWFDQINPGNTVEGDLIFDVPTDVEIASAKLHDSAFSDGVEVKLN